MHLDGKRSLKAVACGLLNSPADAEGSVKVWLNELPCSVDSRPVTFGNAIYGTSISRVNDTFSPGVVEPT